MEVPFVKIPHDLDTLILYVKNDCFYVKTSKLYKSEPNLNIAIIFNHFIAADVNLEITFSNGKAYISGIECSPTSETEEGTMVEIPLCVKLGNYIEKSNWLFILGEDSHVAIDLLRLTAYFITTDRFSLQSNLTICKDITVILNNMHFIIPNDLNFMFPAELSVFTTPGHISIIYSKYLDEKMKVIRDDQKLLARVMLSQQKDIDRLVRSTILCLVVILLILFYLVI